MENNLMQKKENLTNTKSKDNLESKGQTLEISNKTQIDKAVFNINHSKSNNSKILTKKLRID